MPEDAYLELESALGQTSKLAGSAGFNRISQAIVCYGRDAISF
ncbi:MAG: hypothetical protein ACTS8W_02145 [Arsenophonus sp. NC-PY1-MAG3]